MEDNLKALQERNNNLTREECVALLKRLKEERLDPIVALLYTEGGSLLTLLAVTLLLKRVSRVNREEQRMFVLRCSTSSTR